MSPSPLTLLFMLGFSLINGKPPDLSDRVVHAVNCGGSRHMGAYRIVYEEDWNPVGIASDYGSRYVFPNAPVEDQPLYMTERYHNEDFTYTFDIANDGDYVIVLKFSEVYFTAPREKVFHVHVNDLPVKRGLDIFSEARATGAAYDMYIDITIKGKEIVIGDLIGDIDGELQIRFIPELDNPKINAIAILMGRSTSLPSPPAPYTKPPPQPQKEATEPRKRRRSRQDVMSGPDQGWDEWPGQDFEESTGPSHELASGPRAIDPYLEKNDNVFIYLAVTLVCLLPVVAFIMHM